MKLKGERDIDMEPEMKKCRNKKCQCVLPAGSEQAYCEECLAAGVDRKRTLGQSLFDLMLAPGIIAMNIATRGHRRYKKK